MDILQNKSLKDMNWWTVGGEAQHYCQPKTMTDVQAALKLAQENSWPIRVLSGGSNVLVKEGSISGLTLHLNELSGIETVQEDPIIKLKCLAGTAKSELAKIFLQNKLAPAVFLTGIPGDIGGGVVMNAGIGEDRRPREFCEITSIIEVISTAEDSYGALKTYSSDEIDWSYRSSKNWQPGIIVSVTIEWENNPNPDVMKDVREANRKRVSTQPLNQPSCGSVFRNPPGHKSAKLIQDCELKGFSIGGAQVSTKHANFIVNTGEATADDILNLINHVQKTVKEKTGVELHREVLLFGDWDSALLS